MKRKIISVLIVTLILLGCNRMDSSNFEEKIENETLNQVVEESFEGSEDYLREKVINESSLINSSTSGYAVYADGIQSSNQKKSPISKNKFNSKIIRTADLKLKVENVKKASAKIANLVDMNGGYISSQNLSSDKNYYQKIKLTDEFEVLEYEIVTSNLIYVRVPSKNFQKVLSAVKSISLSEDYVKINTQDVSEEYVDLETRLKTKKEVEARYIQILRSKAKTLNDILIAEDKIRVIREEIEVVEGRLNYLKNKVSLSTIQIDIYQDANFIQEDIKLNTHTTSDWSYGEKITDSLSAGWNGILWFIVGLLYFWPFLLIGGVGFWIIHKRLKKKK